SGDTSWPEICVAPDAMSRWRVVGFGSGSDDDFVCGGVGGEGVEGFVVVVDGEAVSDEAFGADPSGAQRGDGGAEGGCFGEGSQDGDLAAEDVEAGDRREVLGVGDSGY